MPRIPPDVNICGRNELKCIEMVRLAVELGQNSTFQCQCLPGCFEIGYSGSLAVSRIGYEGFLLRDLHVHNATQEQIRFDGIQYKLLNFFFDMLYILACR